MKTGSDMEETTKDRLIRFIDHLGLSKNRFEKICGLTKRYVSNNSVSIQPDKVRRIADKFPELNTGWLLTGEGAMLKDPGGSADGDAPKPRGWVARDGNGSLFLYTTRPRRGAFSLTWTGQGVLLLPRDLFPGLDWQDEPLEVRITIARP